MMEEENWILGQQDWPSLQVFMGIWERADRKPERVLNIIEEEDRGTELAWVVTAMKNLQNSDNFPGSAQNDFPASTPENQSRMDDHTIPQGWEFTSRPLGGQASRGPSSTGDIHQSLLSARSEGNMGESSSSPSRRRPGSSSASSVPPQSHNSTVSVKLMEAVAASSATGFCLCNPSE